MRAAFFDYDPCMSAWRYIVLTESDPVLRTERSSRHEEGWSATYTAWSLDLDTGDVTCRTDTDGRDCDGRMSTSSVQVCPADHLAARDVYEDGDAEASTSGPLPFRVPDWREAGRSRRDYSAEAAGY